MNFKQIKNILILIAVCIFIYFILIGQINNKLLILDEQITDLTDSYKIIDSESDVIKENIESLLSMDNINSIAKENNFKKITEQNTINLINDKDKSK